MAATTTDRFSRTQLRKAEAHQNEVTVIPMPLLDGHLVEAFGVPSHTTNGRVYEVMLVNGHTADCNCQARVACWHMAAVALRLRNGRHAPAPAPGIQAALFACQR